MIITIDGPAGAGKSSAARTLAHRLGFEFLDTGAMYRAVALVALRAGINLREEPALAALVEALRLEMPPGGRVLLDGVDVTEQIRTSAVTAATGAVADSPAVRRRLAQMQRAIAAGRNMVCEGRDQGTIVFPDAECKFFLFADPLERARRRQREMEARGEPIGLEQLLREQEIRDQRDAARDLAPMKPADDAVLLDSTRLGPEQVVQAMEAQVQRRAGNEPQA
ncbi:MAG TPA: (d)CMP kinase [Gemmataceae bacterium]|nr:(d)CMP kinase [Gemmataceae bacterium]